MNPWRRISSVVALAVLIQAALGGLARAQSQPLPDGTVPEPTPTGPIEYINPDIPHVNAPAYNGERYDAVAPATLDIAERAGLSINAMTELLNPNADLEPYWHVDLWDSPPRMDHCFSSQNVRPKYFQAIPFCRAASGSRQNLEREYELMRMHLKMQGPDGLIYAHMDGRGWSESPGGWADTGYLATITWENGRTLGGFSVYAHMDPDGPWREAARRLAEALMKLIIVEEDIAYLFDLWMEPGREMVKPDKKPILNQAAHASMIAHGLAQYDRLVVGKQTEATELAVKLLRYIFRESEYFGPDGEFRKNSPDQIGNHFHEHTMVMLVALEVVQMTGTQDLLDDVLTAYDWTLHQMGDKAVPVLGFFPEFLHDETSDYFDRIYGGSEFQSETCGVADMIMIAIMLSKLGHDKMDDADRWIRNQFAENQLTDLSWYRDGRLQPKEREFRIARPHYTNVNVPERAIGAFAGWPPINDWIGPVPASIMNCCTVNGAKALYYIWKNIVTYDEGTLRVNLLLNRASKWADIDSHLPYTGQVDISLKQTLSLQVRIPEWAEPEEVQCFEDGRARELSFDGRYAKLGSVGKDHSVTFIFPVPERTEKVKCFGDEYAIIRRGNTVVSIDPPGKIRPYYQRGHYRNGETLWKKVVRFVPEDELEW